MCVLQHRLKENNSAFQPVQPALGGAHSRKVTFEPLLQDKAQEELFDLRHKVTMLESDNKRLQVIYMCREPCCLRCT